MSQNNNTDNNEAAMVFAVLATIGLIMFAVAMFMAFAMTMVCLFAWNKPLTLGRFTLMPEDARAFVGMGLAGAVLFPAFALFCVLVFGVELAPGAMPLVAVVGYTLGSLGYASAAEERMKAGPVMPAPAPVPPIMAAQLMPPSSSSTREDADSSRPSFRYATWDDEEVRG